MAFPFRTVVILIFVIFYECNADSLPSETEPQEIQQTTNILTNSFNGRPELPTLSILKEEDGQVIKEPVKEENTISSEKVNIQGLESNKDVDQITSLKEEPIFKRKDSLKDYTNNESKVNNATTDIHLDKDVADKITTDVRVAVTTGISGELIKEDAVKNPEGNPALEAKENAAIDKDEATSNAKLTTDTSNIKQNAALKDSATPIGTTYQSTPKYTRKTYKPQGHNYRRRRPNRPRSQNDVETTTILNPDEEVTTEPISTSRPKRPLRYDSTNHYYTSGAQTHHKAPAHNYHRRQYHPNTSYLHKSKESNPDENNEETTDEEVTSEPISTVRTKRPLRYDSTNHYYTSGAQTHHKAPAHTYRRRQYHPNASYLHKSKESNPDENNEETTDEEVTSEPISTLRPKRPLRYDSTNHYYTSGAQTHHKAPAHTYRRRQYHPNASYLRKSKESNTDENNEETTERLITDEEHNNEPTPSTKRPRYFRPSASQTKHRAPVHNYYRRRQYHPKSSRYSQGSNIQKSEDNAGNNDEATTKLSPDEELSTESPVTLNTNKPIRFRPKVNSQNSNQHRYQKRYRSSFSRSHPVPTRKLIGADNSSTVNTNEEIAHNTEANQEETTVSTEQSNSQKQIYRPTFNNRYSNNNKMVHQYRRPSPVLTPHHTKQTENSLISSNKQDDTTIETPTTSYHRYTFTRHPLNLKNKFVLSTQPTPTSNQAKKDDDKDDTDVQHPIGRYGRFRQHQREVFNRKTEIPKDNSKKETNVKSNLNQTESSNDVNGSGNDVTTTTSETTTSIYQRFRKNRTNMHMKPKSEVQLRHLENHENVEESNGLDVPTTTSVYQRFRKKSPYMHIKPKLNSQVVDLDKHNDSSLKSASNSSQDNNEQDSTVDIPTTTSIYQRLRNNRPHMLIKPKAENRNDAGTVEERTASIYQRFRTNRPRMHLKQVNHLENNNQSNENESTDEVPTTTSVYQRYRKHPPHMHLTPKPESQVKLLENHDKELKGNINEDNAVTVPTTTSIYQRFRTNRPHMHIKQVHHLENNNHSNGNNEEESTDEVPTTTSVYQRYRKHPPHMHLTPKPESQVKLLENHDKELKGNINEDNAVTVPTTTSIYQRFRTKRPHMHIKHVHHLENNNHSNGNNEEESPDEVPTTTSVYQRYRKHPPHMHLTPKPESQVKLLENHDKELKGNINEDNAVTVPTTTSIYQRFRTKRPHMHIKQVHHLENNNHSNGNNEEESTDEGPTTTSVYQRYRKRPPHMHLTPKSESQVKDLESHDEQLNDHFKSNINEDEAVTVPTTTSIYQRFRKNRPIVHLKPNLNHQESSVQNEAKTDTVNDVNTTSGNYRKRIHIRPNHLNHNEEANDFNEDNEDSEDTMKNKTVSELQNQKTHDNIDKISEEDVENFEQIHTRNSFGNRRPNFRRRFNSRSYIEDEDSEDDDTESEIMETSQTGRSINHYGRPFRSPTNLENFDLESGTLGVNDPEESTHFLKRRSRENSSYKTDLNESEAAKREINGDKIPSDQNESHNLFSLVGDNDESLFETDDVEAGHSLFDIDAGISFNVKPAAKLILNLPKSFILEENTSDTNSSKLNNTIGESEVENTEAIGLANQDEIAHMQEYIDKRSGLLLNEREFMGEQNKENIENTNAEGKIELVNVDANQWFTVYTDEENKDEDKDKTKTIDEESRTFISPDVSEAIEGRENSTKIDSTANGTDISSKEIIKEENVTKIESHSRTNNLSLTTGRNGNESNTKNSEQTPKAEESKIEDKDESNDGKLRQILDKKADQTTAGTTTPIIEYTKNNSEQTPKAEEFKVEVINKSSDEEISQVPDTENNQTTNETTIPIIDLTTNNSEQSLKAEESKIKDISKSSDEEISQIPDKVIDQITDGTTSITYSTANNSEQTPKSEESKIKDKNESNDEQTSPIPDKAVDQTTDGTTTSITDSTANNSEQTPDAEKSKIKERNQIQDKAVDQTTNGTTTSITDATANNSEQTPKAEDSKIEGKDESDDEEISQIANKRVNQTTDGIITSITDSTANNSEQTPKAEESKIENKDKINDEEISQIPDKENDQTTDGTTTSVTELTVNNSEQTPNAEDSKIEDKDESNDEEISQIANRRVSQTTDGIITSITDSTASNSEQTPKAEESKIENKDKINDEEISQIPDKENDQTTDGTTTSVTELTVNNSEQTPNAEDSKIEDKDESNDEEISQIANRRVSQTTDGIITSITDSTASNSEQTPKAEESKIENKDKINDEEISQIPDKENDQTTDGTTTSVTDLTVNNSEQTPNAEDSKIEDKDKSNDEEISQIPDKENDQTTDGTTTSVTDLTVNNSEQTPNAEDSKIEDKDESNDEEISQIANKRVNQTTDGIITSITDSTANNSEQTPNAEDSKIEDKDESNDEEISQIPDKSVDQISDGTTTSITDSTANNSEQTPKAQESKIEDKDESDDEEISQIPDKEVDGTTTPITTNNLEQTSQADEENVSKEDDSTVSNNNVDEKDKDSSKTNTSDSENDGLDVEPTEKLSITKKYQSNIFKVSRKTTPKSNIEISENEITDAHRNILGNILGKKTKLNVEVKIKDDIMYIPSNVTINEDLQNHNLNFSWSSKNETKYIMSLNLTRNEPKYYEIDSIKLYFVKDGIASVWMKNVTIHPKKDETADRGLTIEIEKDVKVMFSNVEFLEIFEDDQNIENINSAASESSLQVKMVHVEIAIGVLVVVSFFLVLMYIVIRKLRIMSIKKNNKVPTS